MKTYPFLAIQPDPELSEQVAIEITDCATCHHFSLRWWNESDKLRAEFNFDDPVHMDEHMIPLENINEADVQSKTYCTSVVQMTYDEYVALVKASR